MKLLLRTALTALVAAALLGAAGTAAHAEDPADPAVTWMVRPSDGTVDDGRSWVELELDPGESIVEHLLVRNLSTSAVTFQLSAADGYFTENGRFNMLTADRESVDAGTWIDIQETVLVPSGGDVIVPFALTVPENATPGDHPAGVAAGIRSGDGDEFGIESRVGFRVMTRVAGELAPSVAAAASGNYVGTWNPFDPGVLDVDYTVANTGNTRLSVAPRITASALLGLVSFTVPGEEVTEIAPGETRAGAVRFPAAWPLFAYDVTVDADATAVTDELAPGEVLPAASSAVVFAMPLPQLVTLALIALLLWLLWRDRRRRELLIDERIERARQEERIAAGADAGAASEVRRHAGAGFVVAAIVAALITCAPMPASAALAPEPEDPHGVTLHVEILSTPAPTASPQPSPSPSGSDGALATTGGPDLSLLAIGALVVIAAGAAVTLARPLRRRPADRP